MMGTLERCLEAGHGRLSDQAARHLAAAGRARSLHGPRRRRTAPAAGPRRLHAAPQAPSADDAIRARLADVAGDDEEFISELVNAFLSRRRRHAAGNARRRRARRRAAIARAAHKLKGASANLHVNNLATLAFDLETRAKAGQKTDWRADLEKIAAEFARVGESLRTEFGLEEPARKAG